MGCRQIVFGGSFSGNMICLGDSDQTFPGLRSVLNMEEALRKRPFFSSPEELEEDYYEEHLPEKKRRLKPEQVHLLERSFEAENKLEPERKTQLAKKLGLEPRQVAVWFQNRRARWKTKQLEREYEILKSSYESLLSDYDDVAKENEKLRAEVASLTKKLQANKEVMVHQQMDSEQEKANGAVEINANAKDQLSSSSTGGSAVVDEDSPQLIDSGDSYFPPGEYSSCIGAASKEDDGIESSRSYFSDVFVTAEQRHTVEDEPLGWWVWP